MWKAVRLRPKSKLKRWSYSPPSLTKCVAGGSRNSVGPRLAASFSWAHESVERRTPSTWPFYQAPAARPRPCLRGRGARTARRPARWPCRTATRRRRPLVLAAHLPRPHAQEADRRRKRRRTGSAFCRAPLKHLLGNVQDESLLTLPGEEAFPLEGRQIRSPETVQREAQVQQGLVPEQQQARRSRGLAPPPQRRQQLAAHDVRTPAPGALALGLQAVEHAAVGAAVHVPELGSRIDGESAQLAGVLGGGLRRRKERRCGVAALRGAAQKALRGVVGNSAPSSPRHGLPDSPAIALARSRRRTSRAPTLSTRIPAAPKCSRRSPARWPDWRQMVRPRRPPGTAGRLGSRPRGGRRPRRRPKGCAEASRRACGGSKPLCLTAFGGKFRVAIHAGVGRSGRGRRSCSCSPNGRTEERKSGTGVCWSRVIGCVAGGALVVACWWVWRGDGRWECEMWMLRRWLEGGDRLLAGWKKSSDCCLAGWLACFMPVPCLHHACSFGKARAPASQQRAPRFGLVNTSRRKSVLLLVRQIRCRCIRRAVGSQGDEADP
eukprot:scaffold5816_cov267-Pinguiococcus_pyrenoidosus.AAC.11